MKKSYLTAFLELSYIFGALGFDAIIQIIRLISLGDMCRGTSSGGNYVYLFCNKQIWLPFSIVFDVAVFILGWIILKKLTTQPWYIKLLVVMAIFAIPFFGSFLYNVNILPIWWINVTGQPARY